MIAAASVRQSRGRSTGSLCARERESGLAPSPGLPTRVADFLQQLDAQDRAFFLAYDPVARLGVLRHKDDAGLREWRGRPWRMFGGRLPVIVPVAVTTLLVALDRAARQPVPGTRFLWWSPRSGFALRSTDTAPEPDELVIRDAYDLPSWRPEYSLLFDIFPRVAFDGQLAVLRLKASEDAVGWLNGSWPHFDGPATVIELETVSWARLLWQLAAWPRGAWVALGFRPESAPELFVRDAIDPFAQGELPLRDAHALPAWAVDHLNILSGVEPSRTAGLAAARVTP